MKPIVVVGSRGGQLARALVTRFESDKTDFVLLDRARLDLARPVEIAKILPGVDPLILINAAAYTDVAGAQNEKALAQTINGESPGVMARFCAEKEIPFITFSTDYVFDGNKKAPYVETDETNPLSEYGHSKLMGEKETLKAGGLGYVFRTSWVYSREGKNFVNTMLKLAKEKEELQVVVDQIGAPTYADDLSKAIVQITSHLLGSEDPAAEFAPGLYHLTNGGQTSWYDFAAQIFETARKQGAALKVRSVKAVLSKDYKSPVARPLNSVLSNQKVKSTFRIEMRNYQAALAECLARKVDS